VTRTTPQKAERHRQGGIPHASDARALPFSARPHASYAKDDDSFGIYAGMNTAIGGVPELFRSRGGLERSVLGYRRLSVTGDSCLTSGKACRLIWLAGQLVDFSTSRRSLHRLLQRGQWSSYAQPAVRRLCQSPAASVPVCPWRASNPGRLSAIVHIGGDQTRSGGISGGPRFVLRPLFEPLQELGNGAGAAV